MMDTREKLKRILGEWISYEIPPLYTRRFDQTLLTGNEILSIIGARRAGKTYLCYQIVERLRQDLPRDNILYINLEDERLYPLKGDELTLLWDVYLEMFSVRTDRRILIIVDEIQNGPHWSKWARRITDEHRNLKLIITGSSSKLLSREIATELRGRTLSFITYPLSFNEYLTARKVSVEKKNVLYSADRITLKKYFNEYVRSGGFPATIESAQPEELLKEYYRTMFYRDLVERYAVKNIKLFEDYLTLVLDQTSSYFSISATAKKLGEFGHSLSKNTLSNFSRYAQDVFLTFEMKVFSYKVREQLRAPRKLYAIDHGLVRAVRFSFSEDYGKMIENIAFLSLKRRGVDLYYHRGTKECDFLAMEKSRVTGAFQVTRTMSEAKTRDREIAGLIDAMVSHKLTSGIILTEDEHDTITLDKKTISVLPMWYWLLSEA